MAEVIWTVPALNDLEGILEYIELDDEFAARRLARNAFETTDQLSQFPASGNRPKELAGTPYRRLVVGPILIYHRNEGEKVFVVHVRRGEMKFSLKDIAQHGRPQPVESPLAGAGRTQSSLPSGVPTCPPPSVLRPPSSLRAVGLVRWVRFFNSSLRAGGRLPSSVFRLPSSVFRLPSSVLRLLSEP